MAKSKKPTEAKIKAAIKLLAENHMCITHAINVLDAGGIKSHLLVVETSMGNGCVSHTKTMPRFMRGMARRAIAEMTEESKR